MKQIITRLAGLLLLLALSLAGPLNAAEQPTIVPLTELREGLTAPTRLAVDDSGNLFVADRRQQAVLQFNPDGVYQGRFDSVPVFGSGLAVSADGRQLFIADRHNVNIVDTESGKKIGQLGAENEFGLVGSIAIDVQGRVFVADSGERLIKAYQLQNSEQLILGQLQYSFGQGRFASIFAMAVDRVNNTVYVADGIQTYSSQRRVEVFDLSGALQRTLNFDDAFGEKKLGFVGEIGFDDAGRTYVADKKTGNLRILSNNGQFLGSLLLSGHTAGQLWQPRGLAYLPGSQPGSGRLLVANSDGRISIFDLDVAEPPILNENPPTIEETSPAPLPTPQQLEAKVAQLRELANGKHKALLNRIAGALGEGNLTRVANLTGRLVNKTDGDLAAAAAEFATTAAELATLLQ